MNYEFSLFQSLPKAKVEKQQTRGSFLTGNNEWNSPAVYVDAARRTMGSIDVDPASNLLAQETIKAGKFYTISDSGLGHDWSGNCWLNPPYGRGVMGKFVFKLIEEYVRGRVTSAVLLTNNYTEVRWAVAAAKTCSAECFTKHRIKFYSEKGIGEAPPHGQVFYYFGKDVDAFYENFNEFGYVVVPYKNGSN